MKYAKIAFCCILYLIGNITALHYLEQAQLQYDSVSLRYDNGIEKQQILQVKDYLSSEKTEQSIFPTFWKEEEGFITTAFQQVSAKILVYLGEGYRVYHSEFLSGGYPIENDTDGCAISDALAFVLYGSTDVVGQVLKYETTPHDNNQNINVDFDNKNYEENQYVVRGVFKEDTNLALFAGKTDGRYKAVELDGDMEGNPEQTSNNFIVNSGLEEPDQIVYGSSIVSILRILVTLPFILMCMWVLIYFIKLVQNKKYISKELLLFLIFLLIGVMLPTLLEGLPQWLLPTKWSDFSFWQSLLETMKLRVEEWFYLKPTMKDVEIKFIMVSIGLAVTVQLLSTYVLYSLLKKEA